MGSVPRERAVPAVPPVGKAEGPAYQGLASFFCKGKMVNAVGFVTHRPFLFFYDSLKL